jgi:hypothetical protein
MPMNSSELRVAVPGQTAETDSGSRAERAMETVCGRIGYSAKQGDGMIAC